MAASAVSAAPTQWLSMLSIVIPVKNGGSDLERCLDAIRMQQIDDEVEIIVVDSG
jgi:glycosyltransferase involved in cell wall biosynthesis